MFLQRGRRPGDVSGQEMSAAEADFCGKSSRIPAVKAEVLYEYDSKHRAVNMSASSDEEIGVSSTLTNKPDQLALAAAKQYIRPIWDGIRHT